MAVRPTPRQPVCRAHSWTLTFAAACLADQSALRCALLFNLSPTCVVHHANTR